MSLTEWMNSKTRTLVWFDIGLVKLATAAIILMIAKFWSPLRSLEWYWYGVIFLAAGLPVMYKILK